MKGNKLAIFDIDGTLTKSVLQHQLAFTAALKSFGLNNFNADFGGYRHHTDTFIFKTIFEEQLDREVKERDVELFEDRLLHFLVAATLKEPVREIEGATHYLDFLRKNQEADIVFATGSLLKPAKLKLEQTGIVIEEELLVCSNAILSREEIVATAIDKAKHFYGRNDYQYIVSFGDGRWDYETAQKLNIDFAGIANEGLKTLSCLNFYLNYNQPQLKTLMNNTSLLPAGSNFIIHSPEEIFLTSQRTVHIYLLTARRPYFSQCYGKWLHALPF